MVETTKKKKTKKVTGKKGKPVIIVESPAKAKTIAKFLGKDYLIEASVGHIRDLPRNAAEIPAKYKKEKWARLGIDVENDFKPLYVVPKDKREHMKKLKQMVAQANIVYLATDEDREGESIRWIRLGGCGCDEKCSGWVENDRGIRRGEGGKNPKTRQIETIDIAREDAISDSGQEINYLMQSRNVDNVILMGVHTNICVLGRPFGLRQMVYWGKNVVLCRDLTDAIFRPPSFDINHFRGTNLIVEHIEKHWCPTITSTAFTNEPAFRFGEDAPALINA